MKRELTRRHSSLRRVLENPFAFARDVHQYGKLAELGSFAVWEAFHRVGVFPRAQYVRFDDGGPFRLDGGAPLAAQAALEEAFRARGLGVSRSPQPWKALFLTPAGKLFGCRYPDDDVLHVSLDGGRSLEALNRFSGPIKSIFITSSGTVFVCAGAALHRSADGACFARVLDFASPESFFRHNNAMTQTPTGTLVVGEYGNVWQGRAWRPLAYLYFSSDDGETWRRSDFLIRRGANKHVHLVKYSRALNRVFVADGDNRKRLWVSEAMNAADLAEPANWTLVNRFHIQMGGYTSQADGGGMALFGTDYQGGTNFIVRTADGRRFERAVVPDPYRRSPIDNMVPRAGASGSEIWANLPYSRGDSLGLLMFTADAGHSWRRLIEYRRSAHKVWLLSASTDASADLYLSVEDSRNADRVVYRISG